MHLLSLYVLLCIALLTRYCVGHDSVGVRVPERGYHQPVGGDGCGAVAHHQQPAVQPAHVRPHRARHRLPHLHRPLPAHT